jgi:hypothetical protein
MQILVARDNTKRQSIVIIVYVFFHDVECLRKYSLLKHYLSLEVIPHFTNETVHFTPTYWVTFSPHTVFSPHLSENHNDFFPKKKHTIAQIKFIRKKMNCKLKKRR